jgi:SAM-dependent methyltransferase
VIVALRWEKVLFSRGDIIDLYYQLLQKRRFGGILRRFFMSSRDRTRTWWSSVSELPGNWWAVPAVTRRWNVKISGDPEFPYSKYIGTFFPEGRNVRLLSPGCGEGQKECAIAALWPQWQVTGFDLNPQRIEAAKQHAERQGLRNVTFLVQDITGYDENTDSFDMVLFDSSLHHFSGFDSLLPQISALLRPDGILVLNEYVGPDRFQWTEVQLKEANRLRNISGHGPIYLSSKSVSIARESCGCPLRSIRSCAILEDRACGTRVF